MQRRLSRRAPLPRPSAATRMPRSPKIRPRRLRLLAAAARGATVIAWLRTVVDDPRTERVVMSLIIINAVILGLETSQSVMDRFGPILELLDHIILAAFVIELTVRILVHRLPIFPPPSTLCLFLLLGS